MAALNDLRNGLVIRLNDIVYTIVDCQPVKPGKGGAFTRTKIKRVTDGAVLDRTFRANETIETVRLVDREMQYLYREGDMLWFMDNETFEQHPLPVKLIEDSLKFLKEGETLTVKMDGTTPLVVEMPTFVELQIVETDPGLRGDTVSGGTSRPNWRQAGLSMYRSSLKMRLSSKLTPALENTLKEFESWPLLACAVVLISDWRLAERRNR